MKTGIFLDLDGTLLTDKYTISDFDIFQIRRLKKLGYKFYIVTGKSFNGAIDFYKKLELDTPLIAYTGQVIYWPKNDYFEKEITFIPKNEVDEIIEKINLTYKISNFMIALDDGTFYTKKQFDSNLITLLHKKDKVKKINEIPKVYQAVGTYIEVENDSTKNLMMYTKKLNKEYRNKISFAFWQTDGNQPVIQFCPYRVNKASCMKKIKQVELLDKTIAFGNGWIDRNMLKEADIGYAMKNSAKKIKTFANLTTKFDNNHNGVGHELEKFL